MSSKRPFNFKRLAVIVLIASGLFHGGVFAQETDAKALLDRMDAEIAKFGSFILKGDAYTDARLPAGQIIEHSSEVTARVHRPGMMRITNLNAENTTDIFISGGLLTVYNVKDRFYAQTKIPEGIKSAADFALNEVGIDAPFLDFVSSQLFGQLAEDAQDVQYLGKSLIRGKIFDHIGIRTAEVDIQIWIASQGRPLPGKLAISSKWENGSPRFVAFLSWDTETVIPDADFKFEPPKDATEIGFILESLQ